MRFLSGTHFLLRGIFVMDFFPDTELEQQYVNTTTTIIIVLAVLLVLLIVFVITLLLLYLKNRKRLQQLKLSEFEPFSNDLLDGEKEIIAEYRKLDTQSKVLIKNTMQKLNKD